MEYIKILFIIILIILIYYLFNANKIKEQFNENSIKNNCVTKESIESDFLNKLNLIDENEIIFF
jgi:hypothetical protein